MAERFDFAEEVGRQALLDLLKDILVSNYAFELMFPNVISIWLKIENNVTTVCENIVEVINTIREDRLMAVKVVSKEKEAEFNFKVRISKYILYIKTFLRCLISFFAIYCISIFSSI